MSFTACSKCGGFCDPKGERMTPPVCDGCRVKASDVNALVDKIMKGELIAGNSDVGT